jgi:hypothetical protein
MRQARSRKKDPSPTRSPTRCDVSRQKDFSQSFMFLEEMAATQQPSSLPDTLRLLCPNTPAGLLQCPQCGVIASEWREDRKFAWGRVLYCTCGRNWVVCAYCSDGFDRCLKSKRDMRAHDRHLHAPRTTGTKRKSNDPQLMNTKRAPQKTIASNDDDEEHGAPTPEKKQDDHHGAPEIEDCLQEQVWERTRNSPLKIQAQESLLLAGGGDASNRAGKVGATNRVLFQPETSSLRDFGNVNSSSYFNADINGSGLADIVGKCQFEISDIGKEINPADVQYTTDMAKFVHGLTHSQRDQFATILDATVQKIQRDSCSKACWKTVIPTTRQMLRNQIWEGRKSFLSNIPYPSVEQVGSHGYCSLRACIRDRLAHGFPLEKIEQRDGDNRDPVRTSMQSENSQRKLRLCLHLYKEPVLVLFLKEWQDGYDPHSFSKTNRGSCWVKLITIAEPHDHRNSPEVSTHDEDTLVYGPRRRLTDCSSKFTYPIALGPAEAIHEEVEKRLATELRELSDPSDDRNVMYSKIHQCDIRVHVVLSCSLMDQPERRGANYMLAGNSLNGARWGYTVNLKEIKDRLVPCKRCEKKLFQKDISWNHSKCSQCSQWEMIRSDDFLAWKAPKGFPQCDECREGVLFPKKLRYSHLMYAAEKAHKMIVAGTWSKTQAELFLSYYCIHNQAAAEIVSRAQNVRAFDTLSARKDLIDDYQSMVARKEKFPDEFRRWEFPTMWLRGAEIESMIDVPMHLVFLGAVKGIVQFIHLWLKKHGRYANFMRLAEQRLNTFVKFNLTWFRILPYKGKKLGGWVSENFVSFTRICKWFYLLLNELPPDEPYQDPEGLQQNWKADENRAWLKARGLDTEGLAADLRQRVQGYMKKGDACPPVLPPPPGTPDDLHSLVGAMYDMVKSIMVFDVDDDAILMADMHIKIFLSRLASCDQMINADAEKPYWVSSYTYPCLLNLPDHMRRFGPLKNVWEGSVRGEGSLKTIKPLHGTIGLRPGWPVQIMKKAHVKKGLHNIGTSLEDSDDDEKEYCDDDDEKEYCDDDEKPGTSLEKSDDDDDDDEKEYCDDDEKSLDVRSSHWKYKNVDEIYHDFKELKPLCLVCDREGTFGAILRTGQVVKFACNTMGTKAVFIRNMYFHRWAPVVEQDSKNPRGFVLLSDFNIHYSCVLLPLQLNPGIAIYSGIREDYTMMDSLGGFS